MHYFTEYNPIFDSELDQFTDDVPRVPDFNKDFVGEFDSGMHKTSHVSSFWELM